MLIFRLLISSEDKQAFREKYFYDGLMLKITDFTIHVHMQNKSGKAWAHLILWLITVLYKKYLIFKYTPQKAIMLIVY